MKILCGGSDLYAVVFFLLFFHFFRAGMMWVFMVQSKFRLLILMVWQTMEWSWTTTMCHQFALQVAVLSWQENIPYTQVNICYNQLNVLYTPVGNYQLYLLQFKFSLALVWELILLKKRNLISNWFEWWLINLVFMDRLNHQI